MTATGFGVDLGPLRRSRDLRLLFVGGGVSFFGQMLTYVAVPFQVYRITRSSLVVGLVSLAQLAALLPAGFLGGALADAADRRRMLRATELGLALTTGGLLANALVGHHLAVVFLAAFFHSGLNGLQRPSLDALVPRLVGPDEMAAIASTMTLRYQVGQVAGPALAGVAIAGIGLAGTYAIDLATYVFSLGALWMLGATVPPAEGAEVSLKAVAEGFRYAVSRRDLLGSYVVDLNAMVFGMPEALFPQIAARLGGPAVLGVLFAAPAAGSLVLNLASGWHRRLSRQGRLILVAAAIWGAAIVGLGFSTRLWEATVSLMAAGAADMASGLGRMTMWNESIPDYIRGRLAGVELLSYASGPTLGNVEAGLVEALAGLRTSIVSGGVVSVLGTAVVAAALPAFRRYRSEEGRALRADAARRRSLEVKLS